MHHKFNLTQPQYNIWLDSKLNPQSSIYNIGGQVHIKGEIEYSKFNKAINNFIMNNDSLRLCVVEDQDGTPFQIIHEYKPFDLPFIDFSSNHEPQKEADLFMKSEFKKNIDFSESPLFTLFLIKISENHYVYFCKFHHIIMDGWSISLSISELRNNYNSLLSGSNEICTENYSYTQFIEDDLQYTCSDRYKKSEEFWKQKINVQSEAHFMPLLFQNYINKTGNSFRKGIYIKHKDYVDLINVGKNANATISTVFMAVLLIFLHKTTGQKDLVIGLPLLNRNKKSFRKTIGLFAETSPLLVSLHESLSVSDVFFKINTALSECYRHQRFPITKIEKFSGSNQRLFDVIYSYEKNTYDENFGSYETVGVPMPCSHQSNSLTIHIMEGLEGEDVLINFDYRLDAFAKYDISSLVSQFETLYKDVIKNPESTVKELSILSEIDKNVILNDFNQTDHAFSSDGKTIVQQFEEQVALHPDATAILYEDMILSYSELNAKANSVAHYLKQNCDVQVNDFVALQLDRSEKMIIALLGVIKAGAAYVPIDTSIPDERIKYIINDAAPKYVITDNNIDDILERRLSFSNPVSTSNMDSILYVIYTSGTTGNPKGTLITNANYSNYINWADDYYFDNPDKGHFGLFTSISFDLTTTSIFLPLLRGKSLTVFNQEKDISEILTEIFMEGRIDSVKLTPSHISLLRETFFEESNVSLAIVGGEELLNEQVGVLLRLNSEIKIVNEYGPTETTVGCIIKTIKSEDEHILIGMPIANTKIHILDDNLTHMPHGVPGEIYISGKGVGIGYLNKPELTSHKFLDDPFFVGQKMYRTGDLGRWLANGDIEFLGRIDTQVKINGHRIELGEIENSILKFEGVKSCVVTVNKRSSGEKFLSAYYCSDSDITHSDLRQFLAQILPAYMIPTYFLSIDSIPLTSNGKLDRTALPDPLSFDAQKKSAYEAPQNDTEHVLVDIWSKILDVNFAVGVGDTFYQLGGDSIKAIQIVSKMKQQGLEGQVTDLMEGLSIREFAARVARVETNSDQSLVSGAVPLTPIQKWFLHDVDCPKHHYNQGLLLDLKLTYADLNVAALNKAVIKLVEHHDALRMSFIKENQSYIQMNRSEISVSLEEYDLQTEFNDKIEEIANEIQCSFNLENDALIRFALLRLKAGPKLLIIAHHLIIDGVSWRILLEDLESAYKQALTPNSIKLPAKTTSYKRWSENLVSYTKSAEFKQNSDFWNNMDLPAEEGLLGEVSTQKIKSEFTLSLTIDETKFLQAKVHSIFNAGINEVLLTAMVKVLNQTGNQKSLLVDLESHGRSQRFADIDVSRTVGWFTSIYPVLFDISDAGDLKEEILSVQDSLAEIPDYGIGYGILKYNSNNFNSDRKAKILFNYLGQFNKETNTKLFEKSSQSIGLSVSPEATSPYDLSIDSMIVSDQLSINLASNLYSADALKKMANAYINELRNVITNINNEVGGEASVEQKEVKKQRIRI